MGFWKWLRGEEESKTWPSTPIHPDFESHHTNQSFMRKAWRIKYGEEESRNQHQTRRRKKKK